MAMVIRFDYGPGPWAQGLWALGPLAQGPWAQSPWALGPWARGLVALGPGLAGPGPVGLGPMGPVPPLLGRGSDSASEATGAFRPRGPRNASKNCMFQVVSRSTFLVKIGSDLRPFGTIIVDILW